MVRKPPPIEPVPPPKLEIPRIEAKAKIEKQLEKADIIKNLPITSSEEMDKADAEETKWSDYTTTLLTYLFDNPSKTDEYKNRTRWISYARSDEPYFEQAKSFRRGMDTRITVLESILGSLEIIPEITKPAKPQIHLDEINSQSKKVFIVHGHDEEAKETVARFIHLLDLFPIILNEQPNEGQTIVEKFEKSSNEVGYAVVLLTPDDIGTSKDKPEELKPRARQNVIFELGYFAAKLGRKKVCALQRRAEVLSEVIEWKV